MTTPTMPSMRHVKRVSTVRLRVEHQSGFSHGFRRGAGVGGRDAAPALVLRSGSLVVSADQPGVESVEAAVEHGRGHVVAMLGSLADAGRNDVCVLAVDARAAHGPDEHYVIPDQGAGRSQGTKNGSGVEYHQRETPITMPKTKSDETNSRPAAAVASAGTTPGDLAHEIDLLGAALRLTPEQRAAARLSAAVVSSRPADDR